MLFVVFFLGGGPVLHLQDDIFSTDLCAPDPRSLLLAALELLMFIMSDRLSLSVSCDIIMHYQAFLLPYFLVCHAFTDSSSKM